MTLEVKDQKSRRLLFAMIFGLLLLNVGLIYKLITKSDQLNETTTELQSTSADLEELQLLEAELRVNLAEKTGQNAQLDSIIGIRDAELQAKVAEIRKMLKSGKLTAAKAKSEIANLRGEIEALTAEIERLSKENQYLKDENYVIQKQVEAEQEKVAEMVVVNTELTKQVVSATRPNLTFEEITIPIYNSTLKLAGKHAWADITVSLRDDASGQISRLIGEQLQKQMDFLEMASAANRKVALDCLSSEYIKEQSAIFYKI